MSTKPPTPTPTPTAASSSARPEGLLVGVCGAGMRSLAELLTDEGWQLWGTDQSPSPADLEWMRAKSINWIRADELARRGGSGVRMVYSPSVPLTDPHRVAARTAGIPESSLPEFLGRLMQGRRGICVAGTHGKSTTTALVGWLLDHAGFRPSVFLGAQLQGSGRSGWSGRSDLLVAESCEYRGHFHHYHPQSACVLSVEPDHFDCFADRSAGLHAFTQFAGQVSPDGLLVVDSLSRDAVEWSRVAPGRVSISGLEPDCDWQAVAVNLGPGRSSFTVLESGRDWGRVELPLPGMHNVRNALAAVALCSELGVASTVALPGLTSFPGLRRRFEVLGTWRGVTHVDDYAHHPTAVTCTLAAARATFSNRRIVAVFQPHQASRTEALFEEFAQALAGAAECHVAPVFAAREHLSSTAASGLSQRLAHRITEVGGRGFLLANLDPFPATLDHSLQPGDVLLVMGAGDIHRLHHVRSRQIR